MSEAARVTVQTDLCTIVDDLLLPQQCDALWNFFQLQSFQRVDALGMQGQWPLEDSGVLRGPTVGWSRKWDAQYPTKSPIDLIMKALVDAADQFAATVGKKGETWRVFTAAPTIYVAGQGRQWHRDADDDVGSWVYYAHPEWNIEWGGELFLSPQLVPPEFGVFLHRLRPMEDHPDPPAWKSHLDNDDANRLLLETGIGSGIGSFVAPRPNRLVIVKGGTPQAQAKVRPSAGRHVHATIGGVFKKP